MLLHKTFLPELTVIGLEAKNKDEAFQEMTDKFCQIKNPDSREEILAALWEREQKMSTGIKKGIAIPHGTSSALDHVQGVLGISQKGIEYNALDGQPVYLLFMILAPKGDSEIHLRLLRRLAMLIDNSQFYTELLAQKDPQRVNEIIKRYEDTCIPSN